MSKAIKSCTLALLILALPVLSVGCSLLTFGNDESGFARIKKPSPEARVVDFPVERSRLVRALEDDTKTQKLRLVEIFRTASQSEGSAPPTYRLFDVLPGSVYEVLGLQSADVLIAADERFLVNPLVFKQYVALLPGTSKAQIEISRAGKPLLFRYVFTGE